MSKPFLKVIDFTDDFKKVIDRFKHDTILVGIPEEKSSRQENSENTEEISNAQILAMNNFGSPAAGIPPWPVMEIGIKAAQGEITEQFKQAAQKALSQGVSAIAPAYERAGIIASNSIKKTINAQINAPALSDSTISNRELKGFKGRKRLIVTGQVRNAITYVIKGKP